MNSNQADNKYAVLARNQTSKLICLLELRQMFGRRKACKRTQQATLVDVELTRFSAQSRGIFNIAMVR